MRGLIRAAVQESETRVDAATGAARVWREPAAGATRAAAGAQEELSA